MEKKDEAVFGDGETHRHAQNAVALTEAAMDNRDHRCPCSAIAVKSAVNGIRDHYGKEFGDFA